MNPRPSLYVDLHSHWLLNGHYLGRPLSRPRPDAVPYGPLGNRFDLEAARAGGVGCVAFTAYVPPSPLFWISRARATLAQIGTFRRAVQASGGRLRQVRTGAEARAAAGEGAVAGVLAIEGGHSLDGDPARIDTFADLGVRLLTLVHMVANPLGDAAESPVHPWGGLSPLGREVLHRMGRRHVIPDVAHLSDDGIRQVLDLHAGPVVSTHTGMRALVDRPRNLSDDMARGIARSGGVAGIILFPPFLDARHLLRRPLSAFLDHVCHAAWVMGPDHVAVGSDMDGYTWTPAGIRDHGDWPRLAEGLADRGFTPAEADAILGGNALRVLDA